MVVRVREVGAADLLDVRSRLLREGRAHEGFPEDDDPDTLHLAAQEGDVVVGVATFMPRDDGAWQLQAMAVDERFQGQGVGRALLAAGTDRVRAAGGRLLWANGRDTALRFYERAGWRVVGDGYQRLGLPHHRVERSLEDG